MNEITPGHLSDALKPKIIRLDRDNGDFYEGVVLPYSDRMKPINFIKLYVTRTNVEGLYTTLEPGTIASFMLNGWTIKVLD